VVFGIRRLIYAFAVVMCGEYFILQFVMLISLCLAGIIYQNYFLPFRTPHLNNMEIFNEVCFIGCVYHLLVFTDFVDGADLKYQTGWSMIMLTLLIIAVNVGMILFKILRQIGALCGRLKRKIDKQRVKKE